MVDKKVIAIAAVAILAIAGVSAFMVVGNNDDGPKADTDFAGKNLEVVDNLDGGIVAVGQDSFRWMTYFGLADKCVMVDQNDIEFEDVNRGAKPYKTIHILNTSDQPSQPQIMHLPPYLSAEVSPTTIAPGHSGEATITLDSHKLRDFGLSQTSIYLGFAQGDKIAADKEITVSAVLLPDFEMLSQEELEDAPHITLSADSLNLGAFNGKKKKRGEIEITNTGLSLLDIRSLQMSTTGLQLSLSKTKIEPGESAKLKVTANAEDFKTIRKTPRILMITNDPNNAKVEIKVKATLR